MRAVECAVRTMFFLPIACEADHHPWLVPAGNLEEKCSVGGGFYMVRTAHPTAGGAVLRRLLPFRTPISPQHGLHGNGAAGTCERPRSGTQ